MANNDGFDTIDSQIVALLRRDGRYTAAHLARELGVSEGTIRKRLKKLTSAKMLRIVGVVDPNKLGYTVHVQVGLQVSPQYTMTVANQLASLDPVRYVALSAGSFEIILAALFKDRDELFTFATKTLGRIPGIIRVEIWHMLRVIKRQYDWIEPTWKEGPSTHLEPTEIEAASSIDMERGGEAP